MDEFNFSKFAGLKLHHSCFLFAYSADVETFICRTPPLLLNVRYSYVSSVKQTTHKNKQEKRVKVLSGIESYLVKYLNQLVVKIPEIFFLTPMALLWRLWGSGAVYGILLLGQECCSFNQYNLRDRMLQLIFNQILY